MQLHLSSGHTSILSQSGQCMIASNLMLGQELISVCKCLLELNINSLVFSSLIFKSFFQQRMLCILEVFSAAPQCVPELQQPLCVAQGLSLASSARHATAPLRWRFVASNFKLIEGDAFRPVSPAGLHQHHALGTLQLVLEFGLVTATHCAPLALHLPRASPP